MTESISTALGFDDRGAARDRTGLFAAAGLHWPAGLVPETVHSRVTDYPFSADVSNNRILAAVDRAGYVRRAVTATGIDDVRGNAIPGVYVHKLLAFGEGRIGIDVRIGDELCAAPSLDFTERVLPTYADTLRGVTVRRTVFAPDSPEGRPTAIAVLVEIEAAAGSEPMTVTLQARSEWGPGAAPSTLPAAVTLLGDTGPAGPEVTVPVVPGTVTHCAAVLDFGAGAPQPFADVAGVRSALAATLRTRRGSLGRLQVDEDPWAGEIVTRAAELARQAVLLLPDGAAAGSFWGSNANPIPDVWTRDLGYSALGLLDSDPVLAARVIDFLAAYGLPDAAWEREAALRPEATGLEHSLGNACLAAVLGALHIRRHGEDLLAREAPRLREYLRALAGALLDQRPVRGGLYRTLYISDGPSRGDYHTGSNILAWRAAVALSTELAESVAPDQARDLAALAADLREAIDTRCVHRVAGTDMYVEGIYDDGRYVAVHDGEETDLTLASIYGYADRDDHRVRDHARWAHSPGNPYFASRTGGVDFWDWDDYNGVTYPGHVHRLSAAGSRRELTEALAAIRRTSDLDGSFWWWPFRHGETDPARVKRGLGKCGWCAGEFAALMLHDVAGISRDHRSRSVTFAPFVPWRRFRWEGLGFLGGTVDFEAEPGAVTVVNNTPHTIRTTLQVTLEPDSMIEDVRLNGENHRYQSEVVSLHDCVAVRGRAEIAPGARATLRVDTSAAHTAGNH